MPPNHITVERSGADNVFFQTFKNIYKLDLQSLLTNQTRHDSGLVEVYDCCLKNMAMEMYLCTGNS